MQSSKKDQEFRSIFQHVQNAQLKRCPSELFAQHIVTIVHHIKGESSRSLGVLTYGIKCQRVETRAVFVLGMDCIISFKSHHILFLLL